MGKETRICISRLEVTLTTCLYFIVELAPWHHLAGSGVLGNGMTDGARSPQVQLLVEGDIGI